MAAMITAKTIIRKHLLTFALAILMKMPILKLTPLRGVVWSIYEGML